MKKNIPIRLDLKNWEEYTPVKSAECLSFEQKINIEDVIKCDANESVYGPSPLVMRQLSQFKGYQYYPDPEYTELRKQLSDYTKVAEEKIFVSNGADELIDLLVRLIIEKDDEVIDCPPTFSSYSLSTRLNRGKVINVLRNSDYSLDIDSIIRSITRKTKIIFICNPNNPTGTITPIKDIEKILKTGIMTCVDEAYIEFGGECTIPLLKKYKNLIIIRSLSKWAGIAGLRLGYGLMDTYIVKQLMKIKSPYNVSYAAVLAGIASLRDTKYREATLKKIVLERNIFERSGYSGGGNFIFIKTTKQKQRQIIDAFAQSGISIRAYVSGVISGALRITVGKPDQNSKMRAILKQYL
jgi:histidinol-phosphate aminotransferase